MRQEKEGEGAQANGAGRRLDGNPIFLIPYSQFLNAIESHHPRQPLGVERRFYNAADAWAVVGVDEGVVGGEDAAMAGHLFGGEEEDVAGAAFRYLGAVLIEGCLQGLEGGLSCVVATDLDHVIQFGCHADEEATAVDADMLEASAEMEWGADVFAGLGDELIWCHV